MDVCPYAGNVTDEKADQDPPKHIVAQNRLHLAFLIRCLSDGERGYFILEDVATRRQQRFDSAEALLARLAMLVNS